MKTTDLSAAKGKRTSVTLLPDRTRVLIRPFNVASGERAGKICNEGPGLAKPYDHRLVLDYIRQAMARRDRSKP